MRIRTTTLNRFAHVRTAALCALAVATLASTPALAGDNDNDGDDFLFDLIRSAGLTPFPAVAPHAHGRVKIESVGPVENYEGQSLGLPPNIDFDLFVIQVPNKPFSLSWYQGDIETNKKSRWIRRVHRPIQHFAKSVDFLIDFRWVANRPTRRAEGGRIRLGYPAGFGIAFSHDFEMPQVCVQCVQWRAVF